MVGCSLQVQEEISCKCWMANRLVLRTEPRSGLEPIILISANVLGNDIHLRLFFRYIHHVFSTVPGHRYLMVGITTAAVKDCGVRPWYGLSMYPGRQYAKRREASGSRHWTFIATDWTS